MAGLLVVCLVLAAGLVTVALLNHRAAGRAARDVMFRQAGQAAATFLHTARGIRALHDRQALERLAGQMSRPDLTLTVATVGPPGSGASAPREVARRLHLQEQLTRTLTSGGETMLEGWYPIRPRRGGPHGRGRGGKGWGRKRGPGPGGVHLVLRVRVPISRAAPLVSPARTALAMSGVVSLALVLLGVLLFRWASRARRVEHELQRRRALAALGEMAAVLAHEIRTPLASIKGNAQLLGEANVGDERASAVVREAARMERLVNGMLDYARPPTPAPATCEASALVTRAAELVAPRAMSLGVAVLTESSPGAGQLTADTDQLLQVLVNLLNNAVEATAGEGAEPAAPVVISAGAARGQCLFRVLDRGAGLGGASLDSLSRPFHGARTGGAGLGLSVARRLVEQHGGTLSLRDREGGGAEADVLLPRSGPPPVEEGP